MGHAKLGTTPLEGHIGAAWQGKTLGRDAEERHQKEPVYNAKNVDSIRGVNMNRAGKHWLSVAAVKIGMTALTVITLAASLLCMSTYAWIARCGGTAAEGAKPWLGW